MNLGTGENGRHPDFLSIIDFLRAQPVKLAITSNGHRIAILDDEHVRAFHDVELSLDYPSEVEQDAQSGAGNWTLIHEQALRCCRLGVPVTIIAVPSVEHVQRKYQNNRAETSHQPTRLNCHFISLDSNSSPLRSPKPGSFSEPTS